MQYIYIHVLYIYTNTNVYIIYETFQSAFVAKLISVLGNCSQKSTNIQDFCSQLIPCFDPPLRFLLLLQDQTLLQALLLLLQPCFLADLH